MLSLTGENTAVTTDLTIYPSYQEDYPATVADAKTDDVSVHVEVPAGANATVVAHLDEGGDPTLTPFVNDTSATAAGVSAFELATIRMQLTLATVGTSVPVDEQGVLADWFAVLADEGVEHLEAVRGVDRQELPRAGGRLAPRTGHRVVRAAADRVVPGRERGRG